MLFVFPLYERSFEVTAHTQGSDRRLGGNSDRPRSSLSIHLRVNREGNECFYQPETKAIRAPTFQLTNRVFRNCRSFLHGNRVLKLKRSGLPFEFPLLGGVARFQPRRAASIMAMSIFFIVIIASNARLATAGSGLVIPSVRAIGVICQDNPHLSLHQPH